MSFILDALKKSENDRQRQSGPGLFEVKVAAPKARFPVWALALAALLAINISVVGWLVLRQPSRASVANAAPAEIAPPAAQVPLASAPVAAPSTPVRPPATAPIPEESQLPSGESPGLDSNAVAENSPTPAVEEVNPEDYQPAAELPASPADTHVRRGTMEGLPTYEQVAGTAGSGVPDLRLDLHVYATKPQDRFIFLNMHRLREGDSLPEGVRVDQITPDGAVLSFRTSKFVIERD